MVGPKLKRLLKEADLDSTPQVLGELCRTLTRLGFNIQQPEKKEIFKVSTAQGKAEISLVDEQWLIEFPEAENPPLKVYFGGNLILLEVVTYTKALAKMISVDPGVLNQLLEST